MVIPRVGGVGRPEESAFATGESREQIAQFPQNEGPAPFFSSLLNYHKTRIAVTRSSMMGSGSHMCDLPR